MIRSMSYSPSYTRITVVGTTGSGKTTLARKIAEGLEMTYVELDAIYWQPNWVALGTVEFQAQTTEALKGDRWVVDGNYSAVRPIVWSRAQVIVWLDYSFMTILLRLLRRTARRAILQESLWNGNHESWRKIFSGDSIIIWLFKTYWRRRHEYPRLLAQPVYAHLISVRLRSPQEADAWLRSLLETADRKKAFQDA